MPTYKVKLWTFDGRTRVFPVKAADELRAAAAAIPHFVQLGEDVLSTAAVDVERVNGKTETVRPQDVLDWRREHGTELDTLEQDD